VDTPVSALQSGASRSALFLPAQQENFAEFAEFC
jgi:hypothetical protein